ncbi:MAG: hypothetical protein IH989_05200 [Planctomycetes bacterium]|nr:hypothetical protein [Planctomycetota bacterium]
MLQRLWRPILIASVGAWAALSPALAPGGDGSALAQDPCDTPDANLDLNVAAGSEFVAPGDVVTVRLDVSNLTSAINGAQALIHYDDSILTLTGVTTNSGPDWGEGFPLTDVAGDITYTANIFGGSTSVDGTIATLTFLAIAEGTTNITFWEAPPLVSKLTRFPDSTTLLPCLGASGNIVSACDDGLFCNGLEAFVAGACLAGTSPSCDDSNECTDDACDPAGNGGVGACTNLDNTIACDDGQLCTENDVCSGGTCSGSPFIPGLCDDLNVCTDDGCDSSGNAGAGACTNLDNTITCDDGQLCTENDVCSGGVCAGTPFVPGSCDDSNGCTDDACDSSGNAGAGACTNLDNTSACDDSQFCTENDVCERRVLRFAFRSRLVRRLGCVYGRCL